MVDLLRTPPTASHTYILAEDSSPYSLASEGGYVVVAAISVDGSLQTGRALCLKVGSRGRKSG
jgi:hypothetical protein